MLSISSTLHRPTAQRHLCLYLLFQGRAFLGRQLFAVIQPGDPLFTQHHGGGHDGPRKRSAPGFVYTDNHIRQAG